MSENVASKNQVERKVIQKKRFVDVLFEILGHEAYKEYISWHDGGSAFVVWRPKLFASKILPMHFNHSNFASFERQLNFYRFQKMGVGDNKPTGKRLRSGAPVKFRHKLFRVSSGDKLHLVERKSCPKQSKKLEASIKFLRKRNEGLRNENASQRKRLNVLIHTILFDLKQDSQVEKIDMDNTVNCLSDPISPLNLV